MELHVESRNVTMTPRWKAEIEARMADLESGHDDLLHGQVTLTKNRHHRKDRHVAETLVVVTLPGGHTRRSRRPSARRSLQWRLNCENIGGNGRQRKCGLRRCRRCAA